jgi:hypothetical protein
MKLENVLKLQNSKVQFKVKKILPQVYHLQFNNRKDLTSTLLRFEEFYESPKFRNKVFSMNDFYFWYKTTRDNKKFSYLTDWSGFNFPSYVFQPFWNEEFENLSTRENAVLKKFPKSKNKFYIIGTFKNKSNIKDELLVFKHEVAHALYYLDSSYRKNVSKILKDLNSKPIHKYLKKLGYHEAVLEDETHAYYLTDQDALKEQKISISQIVAHKLEANYQKYYQKYQAKAK